MLEIKRLNASTAALRSEMNKYEEQLEDCRKYKEFMDSITPPGEERGFVRPQSSQFLHWFMNVALVHERGIY